MTRVLAAERAARAHVLEALEVRLAAADARHARPQHRDQPESAGAVRRIGEERAHAVGLVALDVDQEHVGRVRGRSGSRTRSSRLACSDRTPTMKNAPRPTASRMTRVWLPGRDRCSTACRSGNDRDAGQRRDQRAPAAGRPAAARAPAPAEAGADDQADAQRAACQAVSATSAADTSDQRRPAASSRAGRACDLVAQQQRRLDEADCSSGTTENSSDTSTPMPMPCAAALQVTP